MNRLGPERYLLQAGFLLRNEKRDSCNYCTSCGNRAFLLGYGGWEMIPVGIACIIFAFLYTTGPYPLAYHGWGDILVLVFFSLYL